MSCQLVESAAGISGGGGAEVKWRVEREKGKEKYNWDTNEKPWLNVDLGCKGRKIARR